ncbi:Murein DD-endopeptidase MepM and murein hydrolase activator NlpD, contain LysM domain [Micromonospora rhizosphaerae]|uniref:Murein DD-endopeptidase MepM and murein hydrolase activator NlpD, contain LysM domain n=1 Tax=Micromonospora rhizosphaerae TaxID=568872 RepID=A0A1C6SIU0_9ACTN|nr:M23 family metallopeptidase [Micromonospora rhizosphaerae]SCL29328.1 Murein DD-endopeptidase MepM and murein hydrolase activator NlpD, contain LysM domain [Micromonospora rhizosphaerae]
MNGQGPRKATLAAVAGAAALMMASVWLDVGAGTAAARSSAQGPLPLPTLPIPSVSVSLPPVNPPQVTLSPIKPPLLEPTLEPSTAPTAAPTAGPTAPTVDTPPTGGSPVGVRPEDGGPMASPGSAAAIIAADPAADLYPQPPVDAAVTPQARQVAALTEVQHRIQYLHNILARTRDDLTRLQREPDPMLQLLTALTAGAAPASGAASPAPLAAADSADVVDTPTGRAVALSAAITSGQAELTRRQQEEASLRQEIDRRVRPALAVEEPAGAAYGGGRLGRPLSGRLTSRFGTRFDPYYKVWQLHPGVDLAAPIGTPILAAADGRVTRAGWYGGYGNYTCIDHGRADGQRLSTCYGHQSRLLVSPGQRVRAGQVIGLVGSTGASTGPHLHFEVRLGGRPVDPLPWI